MHDEGLSQSSCGNAKRVSLSTYSMLGTLHAFPHLIITTGLLGILIIPIFNKNVFIMSDFKYTHKERKYNGEPPCSFNS